jgi:tRNA (mo5U34)-methyltransferase
MHPNYLDFLSPRADRDAILGEHRRRLAWAEQNKKGFLRFREPASRLARFPARHLDIHGPQVTIGLAEELDQNARQLVYNDLRQFMPWRKGPFSIFGTIIDAEWRSDRKWQRLEAILPDLSGKVVADIGCNNGYYMFRMAAQRPALVLGFEPTIQHYYCFTALNAMAGCDNLAIDLLGVEHLSLFTSSFDVVFLMGIIYHRPSPLQTLRDIHAALKPGGTLIVESQAIPGEEHLALFPTDTYAKVPGTYFVPTGPCLINWMAKAGFADLDLFCRHPMSGEEQRRTPWMTFESYEDFLAPGDPSRTFEGYPAPWRIFVKGYKKG